MMKRLFLLSLILIIALSSIGYARTFDTTAADKGQTCSGDKYGDPGTIDGVWHTGTGRQTREVPTPVGVDERTCSRKLCAAGFVCDGSSASDCNGKCRKWKTGDPVKLSPPGTVEIQGAIYADKGTHCKGYIKDGKVHVIQSFTTPKKFGGVTVSCGDYICKPGLVCQSTGTQRCICVEPEKTLQKADKTSVESRITEGALTKFTDKKTPNSFQRIISGIFGQRTATVQTIPTMNDRKLTTASQTQTISTSNRIQSSSQAGVSSVTGGAIASFFSSIRNFFTEAKEQRVEQQENNNDLETPSFLSKRESPFKTVTGAQTKDDLLVPSELIPYEMTYIDDSGNTIKQTMYYDDTNSELFLIETASSSKRELVDRYGNVVESEQLGGAKSGEGGANLQRSSQEIQSIGLIRDSTDSSKTSSLDSATGASIATVTSQGASVVFATIIILCSVLGYGALRRKENSE